MERKERNKITIISDSNEVPLSFFDTGETSMTRGLGKEG
jgi:hypothetical protein